MTYPQGPAVHLSQVPNTPQVRRAKPKPFQRPVVSVTTPPAAKRAWGPTPVWQVLPGDTVADFGQVTAVHEVNVSAATTSAAPDWSVTLVGTDVGQGAPTQTWPGAETVLAFTPEYP